MAHSDVRSSGRGLTDGAPPFPRSKAGISPEIVAQEESGAAAGSSIAGIERRCLKPRFKKGIFRVLDDLAPRRGNPLIAVAISA